MRLASLTTGRIVEDDRTHSLFDIDDFLSDEPIRKRQSAISRSTGPMRMGRRIEDVPDHRSERPQLEPDEPGYDKMPDYGMDDEEDAEKQGSVYRGHQAIGAEPELAFQQSELEPTQANLGVPGPEPEDATVRAVRQPRPGAKAWKDWADPERSWKAHRPRQYVGESLDQPPTIKKDGIYVFDKDDDWPILVKVLEVKGNQAKVQLTAGFRTDPRGGATYWVSTRDLKPDRI